MLRKSVNGLGNPHPQSRLITVQIWGAKAINRTDKTVRSCSGSPIRPSHLSASNPCSTAGGPGKFDAELFLDGKAFNPQQVTNNVVTGTNMPGATLLPNARGLSGHNLHTWTGGWGTVTYWNAFVAVNELHGTGTFFR